MDSFLTYFSICCCLVLSTDSAVVVPSVTLSPSTTAYVNNGSLLTLSCGVDKNGETYFVYFEKNGINRIFIYDVPNCASANLLKNETNAFNVSCNGLNSFTMLQKTASVGDHGARWRCFLTPSGGSGPCAGSPNPCTSLDVTIFVSVPVNRVQLTDGTGNLLFSPVAVAIGTSAIIRCNTSPNGSRPRAIFHWYKRHGNQSDMLIENQFISSTPDPDTVPGQIWQDLVISYSTLMLMGNKSFHKMYIFCAAQNEASSGPEILSAEIQLNILYPPIVSLNPNNSAYNVTEGKGNFILKCDVLDANPQPQANAFIWRHQGTILQGQTSASYLIQSVHKSDDGQYQCSSSNPYGTGTSSIVDLSVLYAPELNMTIDGLALENMSLSLRCEVKGVPAKYAFHPWKHMLQNFVIRSDLIGIPTSSTNSGHNTLILERLSLQDMGTYICSVDNGIKGINGDIIQTGTMDLKVTGMPYLVKQDKNQFTEEVGHNINISIPFYSHPAIMDFTFQRNYATIINNSKTSMHLSTDTVDYEFYGKPVQLEAQVAYLYIQNLTLHDFGTYTLELENALGKRTFNVELDATEPHSPVLRDVPVGAVVGGVFGGIVLVIVIVAVAVVTKRWTLKSKLEGNLFRIQKSKNSDAIENEDAFFFHSR